MKKYVRASGSTAKLIHILRYDGLQSVYITWCGSYLKKPYHEIDEQRVTNNPDRCRHCVMRRNEFFKKQGNLEELLAKPESTSLNELRAERFEITLRHVVSDG